MFLRKITLVAIWSRDRVVGQDWKQRKQYRDWYHSKSKERCVSTRSAEMLQGKDSSDTIRSKDPFEHDWVRGQEHQGPNTTFGFLAFVRFDSQGKKTQEAKVSVDSLVSILDMLTLLSRDI